MSDDTRVHVTYYVALIQAFIEVANVVTADGSRDVARVEFSPGVTLAQRLEGLVERAREFGIDVGTPL